jgi:RNA polymerase sigma factor (sigma-70 family)
MTPLLTHGPKSADRAFERLYKRHVHDVYRYTVAVLRNEADAEDVTQSTFLSAYRAFKKGERPVKPHNWLIKIAHNECRQRFRASARRPQEVALQETDGHSRPGADEEIPSAEEIRRALGQLSFNQRAALVMRELEGRSYAEIATVLETSLSAVETLLFRARRALREQLEGGLTCGQAELTLARGLEGTITQAERGPLRAHLRECKECAVLERRQRAHRSALKTTLGAIPLPVSLQSFFGGGAASVGGAIAGSGLAGKVAAVMAAGAVVAGASHEAIQALAAKPKPRQAAVAAGGSGAQSPGASRLALAPAESPRTTRRTKAGSKRAKLQPAGSTAAPRRTLRPSEVEGTAPESAHPAQTEAAATAPSSPASSAAPRPPAAPPPAPLELPKIELPQVELPPLPPLLPLPPPPPLELPEVPVLPPPPPLPPLPPLPLLPPPPPPPGLPLSQ